MKKFEKLNRRDAMKLMGIGTVTMAAGATQKLEAKTTLSVPASHKKARIIIAGGGTGGMIAAARVRRAAPNAQIILIAPNAIHLYQPGQLAVALGFEDLAYSNQRKTADLLPDNVTWLAESVTAFDPQNNAIITDKSGKVTYDILVVALGAEYDYARIHGLERSMIGKHGIFSVYLNDTIKGTADGGELSFMALRDIYYRAAQKKDVNVLFTEPDTPIKGVGTSLSMLFMNSHFLKTKSIRKRVHLTFARADEMLFPFAPFDRHLQKRIKKMQNIDLKLQHNLIAIDAVQKTATFKAGNEKIQKPYDFIHIVPPMQAPKVLRESPLAIAKGALKGWMAADEKKLQHPEYHNVFGIGDVLGIPLGKTGGSAQHQGIVLQDNIASALEEKPLPYSYNGYTVAPLMTEYGKIMLAEFNTQKTLPTLPLDPYTPRWIWWEVDRHMMRWAYFNVLMRGMM